MPKGYENDPKAMPFLEHLRELRRVLVHSSIAIVLGAIVAWAFSGRLLDLLLDALALDEVQYLSPMDPLHARLKIALIIGLGASLPFVSFRVWSFIVPALKEQERRVIVPAAVLTTLLFVVGAAFSVLFLTPMILSLLDTWATDRTRADLTLEHALAFAFRMTVACALLFQLPLVLALTTVLGVTNARQLLGWWRYAILVIFILAALATPGDGPSQIVLAIPLVVLYFVSVLISWAIGRGRGREAAGDGEDRGEGDVREPEPHEAARRPPPGTAPRGSGPDDEPDDQETRPQ